MEKQIVLHTQQFDTGIRQVIKRISLDGDDVSKVEALSHNGEWIEKKPGERYPDECIFEVRIRDN